MTTSEEWEKKICQLMLDHKVKEANDLIDDLVDQGIILYDHNSPYFLLEWSLEFNPPVILTGEYAYDVALWDENAWMFDYDEGQIEKLIEKTADLAGLPGYRICDGGTGLDVKTDIASALLYEMDNDGIPSSDKAWNGWIEFQVKGRDIKDIIEPGMVKDDDDVKIQVMLRPIADEYLEFSDGETYEDGNIYVK